jgi:hypothetical protein
MVGMLGTCLRTRVFSTIGTVFLVAGVSVFAGGAFGAGSSTSRPSSSRPSLPSVMELTPDVVSFLDVPVGDKCTQSVRITNVSERTLQIRKISVSNRTLSITGILLPVVVAPGTSESFTISYQARTQSQMEAEIHIVTDAGEKPSVLKVKASTVTEELELTASEVSIDFEEVAVGSSDKKEVSLTNSGNREVKISAMSISGSDFSVAGAGAVSLSPGQTVSLDVNFAPRKAGRQSGSLKVLSGQGSSLLEVPLNAAGAPSSPSVVKLGWEESPVTVAGYVVYRATDPSGPYMRVSSQAVPTAEYLDSGLVAGHTYYYVVTSLDADQTESEYSEPISATVPKA